MGVACEVLSLARQEYEEQTTFGSGVLKVYSFGLVAGIEIYTLPQEAMEKLGIAITSPEVFWPERSGWYELVKLNDDYRLSFSQIADILEAQAEDWDGTYRPIDVT